MEGNQQKMREALRKITGLFRDIDLTTDCPENEAYAIAAKALSVPPRNCDVGTAEEQAQRFRNFCKMDYISEDCPDDCPLYRKDYSTIRCPFAWAQTPYKAQEGAMK